MRRRFLRMIVFFVLACWGGAPALAQELDPADFEPVLVPAFFFGDGAHGSRWESVATVYNDGDDDVDFARGVLNGDPVCDAICGCGVRSEILAGETNRICPSIAHFAGLLLYPESSKADDLHYHLFVRDRSRDAKSAGTEIPVIRERDLSEKVVLLDVPADARFRSTLRVYDSMARGGVQVQMKIFAHADDGDPIVDETVMLIQHVNYFAPEPFPGHPSIAIIDLVELLNRKDPGPEDVADPSDGDRFRIELTPIAPLERFWAFVSVTSDETNEVTTITP